jgi:hypothetical protein
MRLQALVIGFELRNKVKGGGHAWHVERGSVFDEGGVGNVANV